MKNRTLVVGLGNPILGDDGVGWEVVRRLSRETLPPHVEVSNEALGGISLMERLIGYDQVMIIDAMHTGQFEVGSVHVFPLEDLPNHHAGHLASAHDASLQEALQLGRDLGAVLPNVIWIIAIETPLVYDFSEKLSKETKIAVNDALRKIKHLLKNHKGI